MDLPLAFSGPVNPAPGAAPVSQRCDRRGTQVRPTPGLSLRAAGGGGGSGAGWREPGPEGGEDAPEDREEGNAEVTLSMASRRAAVRALSPLSNGLSC